MRIRLTIQWIHIILLFSFIYNCKGQNKDDVKLNSISVSDKIEKKIDNKDELYVGKIFHTGDELNNYTFIISGDINKQDSLTYSIYKENNNDNKFVYSIEKMLDNNDQEKYKIIDLIKFNNYSPESTRTQILNKKNYYDVILNSNGKNIKKWTFKLHNISISAYEKYLSILLYAYIKNGINEQNIITTKSKLAIEKIIKQYSYQSDFYKDSFFKRESKIIDNTISFENNDIWKVCNEKLDFSQIVSENELESDWSYPYKNIKSLNRIYDLYKNSSYGDSFEAQTLPQQMALYMYFLPWKERKITYDEIDKLKEELKNKNN